MQVVHKQESKADKLAQAKQMESAGDLEAAAKIYLDIIKRDSHNLQAYNRLMIIYRKQKMYGEELAVIQKAINTFAALYAPKTAHNKTVINLSAKLNKAFGMVDKKGNSLYDPGPVAAWKKRKILVEKRMKK